MKSFIIIAALLALPFSSLAQANIDTTDIDGDGLLNSEEDKNGNGIVDEGETDPLDADTDGGGEADGSEIQSGRNPLKQSDDITFDLDRDGLTNGQEFIIGTDPANPDTDGDGVIDGKDVFPLDTRYTIDTDGDGLPDTFEKENDLSPEKRSDAEEDPDGDSLSNIQEFIQGTDMKNPDSDEDGINDGEEVDKETDPLENPCLFYAGPHEKLQDIDGHWSEPYVRALKETKIQEDGPRIISGYWAENGAVFRPDNEISRFELLKIVLLSSCITPKATADEGSFSFSDIARASRPRETEDALMKRRIIYTAYDLDIIDGYSDGTFQPDASINRAEALKILFLASKLKPYNTNDYSGVFSDVQKNDWFEPFVSNALSYEFIEGYEDQTFRPAKPITRAEASKIVLFMTISNPHVNGYVIPVDDLDI